jgi:hypothetical protein
MTIAFYGIRLACQTRLERLASLHPDPASLGAFPRCDHHTSLRGQIHTPVPGWFSVCGRASRRQAAYFPAVAPMFVVSDELVRDARRTTVPAAEAKSCPSHPESGLYNELVGSRHGVGLGRRTACLREGGDA